MSEKHRYHPLTIIIHLLSGIKVVIPLILINVVRNHFDYDRNIFLIVGGVFLVLIGWSCLKYFFESYTVDVDKIVIYEGMIRRKETEVTYERMQAIKQHQWFFLIPFRVVSLQIETAGGGDKKVEVDIPAIPINVLRKIESFRQKAHIDQELHASFLKTYEASVSLDHITDPQSVIYRLTNRQIFLFGVTDLTVFMGLFTIFLTIERFGSVKWIGNLENATLSVIKNGGMIILALGLLCIILTMVFSIIKSMLTFYHFTVSYYNQTLTIGRGLIEKHVQKIPMSKIQGIRVKQNIVRKLLKITSVELILAGGQEQQENAKKTAKALLLPIISERELYQVMQMMHTDWVLQEPSIQPVSRGHWFYFSRWSMAVLLPLIIGSLFFYWWLALLLSFVLFLEIVGALVTSHNQGVAFLSETQICIQNYHYFTKSQTFIAQEKIQSLEEVSTPFLFRKGLSHLHLRLREGNGCLNIKLRFLNRKNLMQMIRFFRNPNFE